MNIKPSVPAHISVAIATHAVLFVATDLTLRITNDALRPFGPADLGSVVWTNRYHYDYASQAVSGKLPYRDFMVEYPVLAFPLLFLPRLLGPDVECYRVGFAVEMFLFDMAAIVLIARHPGQKRDDFTVAVRLAWYTLYCALLAPLLISRYDLAPTVLAFAGASWWFGDRRSAGGIAVALGTLLKVFPGVVAAIGLAEEASSFRTSRARGSIAFLCALAAGLVIWLSLGGTRVVESLGYHSRRGVEVESLYGGALFLMGTLTGTRVPWVNNYNAYHLVSEWGTRMSWLAFPMQAVALLAIAVRFRRSGSISGVLYSAAAVLSFVVFCKVLSPQFMIWLFPFMAVLEGRNASLARKLFLLACASTAMFYPGPGYAMMLDNDIIATLLLNLRNALLVWLLALLVSRSSGLEIDARPPVASKSGIAS